MPLNGVWLDTYIMQIIIQKVLEKSTEILQENLILKTQNFLSKLDIFKKLKKKKNCIDISVFGFENKRKKSNLCVTQNFQKAC